jgi:hypothetical protein
MVPQSVPLLVLLALSQLVFLGVSATLALRLLRLARRTGALPERLLGLHFGLCLFLGYLLLVTGLAGVQRPGLLTPVQMILCMGMGQLLSAAGVFANIVFTWRVFRPDARWAAGLTVALGASMALGIVGYGAGGGFASGRFDGVWFWLYYGAMIAAAAWVAFEALRFRLAMQRRAVIGLGDPLLSNRFLLWGIGSLARLGMLLFGVAEPVVQALTPEARAAVTAAVLTVVSLLGLLLAGSYWLTFFPSRDYVRWVTGAEAGASA